MGRKESPSPESRQHSRLAEAGNSVGLGGLGPQRSGDQGDQHLGSTLKAAGRQRRLLRKEPA